MSDNRTIELTAEQVREAVMSADRWEKPMSNTGLTNTHLIIRDDGWQAIADELNAKRHVETCEMEYQTDGMMSGWWKCSVCGEAMDTIKACAGREKPKYCGNCGRLVVA